MCRLYGFLATQPTRLECSLVAAQNALQSQSDRDSRGVRNADGWGIAHWLADDREVIKSTMPAFADDQFAEIASDIWSEAAIAHVRAATVGRVSLNNTHPFSFGTWAFAHNGTIPAFDHVSTWLDIGPYGPTVPRAQEQSRPQDRRSAPCCGTALSGGTETTLPPASGDTHDGAYGWVCRCGRV